MFVCRKKFKSINLDYIFYKHMKISVSSSVMLSGFIF